jgi:zinc transport system substrate-binding protein
MIKKILCAFLVASFAFGLSACGAGDAEKESATSDDGKVKIMSTVFPGYDFSREIAGDKADVTMLLPPGSESHSFEPTPKDIIEIEKQDIFIYVGGESDEWVSEILESADTSKLTTIKLLDEVKAVEEVVVPGMEEEEEEEESGEPEYDEHVWTSPENAKLIVQKITSELDRIDSANAQVYDGNTSAYVEKLNTLDAEFQDVVKNAKRKTLVFGDRFPFRYFADAYGLDYSAAFPGCSTETECSAKTVAFLVDKVKSEKIPVVFHIELSNKKIAERIAEETGAKVRLLHAAHNVSKDEFESGKTYLEIMQENASTLKEALA